MKVSRVDCILFQDPKKRALACLGVQDLALTMVCQHHIQSQFTKYKIVLNTAMIEGTDSVCVF